MLEGLARRFHLTPDEARRAFALGTILFGLTGSYTLVKTVRDAHFLTQLPASDLPYVYLGVGVLTTVVALLFTRITQGRALWESLAGAALFVAITLMGFARLLRLDAPWVPITFYLWVNVYGLIVIAQFWAFANSLSHPREAKRTFGAIGVGGILGGLAGGAVAAPLARHLTLPSLLTVAAILQAFVGLLTFLAVRKAPAAVVEPAAEDTGPVPRPLQVRYVRLLALVALCGVVVTGLLDFQFKVEIQRRFPSTGDLASFLGMFYIATNLGSLTLQLFGTRWLIQRLGAGWSAAVLPTGLFAGTIAMIAVPGFASATGTRMWDQVARLSVHKSASELFYFPLSPELRRRAKTLIEAGVERVGDAIAGLLILGAAATIGTETRTLAYLVAGLIAVWVVGWFGVRVGYVRELGRNLRRLNLDHRHTQISLREASLLKEMVRLLDSRYERIVVHGMEMLEDNAPDELVERMPTLLEHPAPLVRAHALELVRSRRLTDELPRVKSLMHDDDAEVRVQAVMTYGALSGEDPLTFLEPYLESSDLKLRAAAIYSVVESAPPDGQLRAREILERLLETGDAATRRAVAGALGRRPGPSPLHDLIGRLLRDPDIDVRRAAMRSAGRGQLRAHISTLIDALGDRQTEVAAREGLIGYGDRVVGTLGDYLSDRSVDLPTRMAVPRVLGEVHTQESINALFRFDDVDQVRLGYRVLKAENRIRESGVAVSFPRARITEDLDRDARSYMFSFVHYRQCPLGRGRDAERLLCIALNERMEQAVNRVFRRLALLYRKDEIYAAFQGVISDHPKLRGNSLEYLENALAPDHRALVLPMVDERADDEKLRWASSQYGLHSSSFDETLESILKSNDDWLRACALYVAGTRKQTALLPLVRSNLSSLDGLVRETASWAQLAIVG
jgi:HEAT repeat protein